LIQVNTRKENGLLSVRASSGRHADLIRLEPEFRHVRMTGDDSPGQRLFEHLDRIALIQGAKRRRNRERGWADLVDRMAVGAIGACEGLAAFRPRR